MKLIDQGVPYLDFGGDGDILHFAHANAYPPGCYREFLQKLSPHYSVIASKARPLWPGSSFNDLTSWQQFADDLIQFLDQQQLSNIVGVGHSLGAVVTLIAAVKRPDLFRKIVLIEPVLLSKAIYAISSLTPLFLKKLVFPPIKIALKRRIHWESREEAFQSFRKKRVFSDISDEVLQDYIQHGIKESPDGVTLTFSREWEARVYAMAYSAWRIIEKLEIPCLTIRGEYTDVIPGNSWQRWQDLQPNGVFASIPATGHLIPFENPQLLSHEILSFLQIPSPLP